MNAHTPLSINTEHLRQVAATVEESTEFSLQKLYQTVASEALQHALGLNRGATRFLFDPTTYPNGPTAAQVVARIDALIKNDGHMIVELDPAYQDPNTEEE